MRDQGRAAEQKVIPFCPRYERGCAPLMLRHFDDKFLSNKGIDF